MPTCRVCWHTLLCTSRMIPLATSMKRLERWRRKWRNQMWAEHINNLLFAAIITQVWFTQPSLLLFFLLLLLWGGDYSPAVPLNEAVQAEKKIEWQCNPWLHSSTGCLSIPPSLMSAQPRSLPPWVQTGRGMGDNFISTTPFVSATPNPFLIGYNSFVLVCTQCNQFDPWDEFVVCLCNKLNTTKQNTSGFLLRLLNLHAWTLKDVDVRQLLLQHNNKLLNLVLKVVSEVFLMYWMACCLFHYAQSSDFLLQVPGNEWSNKPVSLSLPFGKQDATLFMLNCACNFLVAWILKPKTGLRKLNKQNKHI